MANRGLTSPIKISKLTNAVERKVFFIVVVVRGIAVQRDGEELCR